VGMRLYNFLVGIFPRRDVVIQTPYLTYVTPDRDLLLKNESDDFAYLSKIKQLDEHRNLYCTDIVMMDPKTMDELVPRFGSIWENI